jgi:hypothetical protein
MAHPCTTSPDPKHTHYYPNVNVSNMWRECVNFCLELYFPPYYVIAEKNFSAYTRSTTSIYNLFNRYECEFHKQECSVKKKEKKCSVYKIRDKPQNIATCPQARERYTEENNKSGVA